MDEDELNQGDADFLAAFESDDFGAPAPAAPEPEAAAEDGVDVVAGEPAAVTLTEDDETISEDDVQPAAAEAPAAPADEEPTDPADVQRAKSWEGRLRAREEELRAREQALKEREAATKTTSEPAPADEPAGPQPTEEQVEQAMESVQGMDEDEALKTLAEDFGDDFAQTLAKLIERKASQIAEKAIGERVGRVDQTVQELIGNLQNDKARSHYEAIADVHPDFMDIAQGEDLKRFVGAMDPEQAKKAQAVIDGGSAKQVIKLLNDFKKAKEQPAPAPVDDAALTAAEGVRSSGMKLPSKPVISNDYEAAWDQF